MPTPSKNIRAERIKGTLDASEFDITGSLSITGSLNVTGGITGSYTGSFVGDGSGLYNLPTTDGPFGISNATGDFTFYNTLQDAINAATSGMTIQVFADYIETNDVTITLKNGVNINGNGYTYTHDNTSNNHTFNNPNGSFVKFFNFNINRLNGGVNSYVVFMENISNGMDLGNSFLKTDNGKGVRWTGQLKNVKIESERDAINSHFTNVSGFDTFKNVYAKSNIGIAFNSHGNPNNCIFVSTTSTAITPISSSKLNNCFILSLGGIGVNVTLGNGGATLTNCIIISQASNAVTTNRNIFIHGCYVLSTGGNAFNRSDFGAFEAEIINSSLISTTARGVDATVGVSVKECYIESTSSNVANINLNSFLIGCTMVTKHNNASSHGVVVGTGLNPSYVLGCNIKVENVSSFCISSNNLVDVFVVNNICQGSTIAINPNINNLQTNPVDAAGNILIG